MTRPWLCSAQYLRFSPPGGVKMFHPDCKEKTSIVYLGHSKFLSIKYTLLDFKYKHFYQNQEKFVMWFNWSVDGPVGWIVKKSQICSLKYNVPILINSDIKINYKLWSKPSTWTWRLFDIYSQVWWCSPVYRYRYQAESSVDHLRTPSLLTYELTINKQKVKSDLNSYFTVMRSWRYM